MFFIAIHKFVQTLRSQTHYTQLTGPEFRSSILLRTLGDDVTEEYLINECPTLNQQNDKLGNWGTTDYPNTCKWEDQSHVNDFFEELN